MILKMIKKYWVIIATLLFLTIAFYPVIFQGKTLLTYPFTVGVMGFDPPYQSLYKEMPVNHHHLDPGASGWQDEPWAQKASSLYKNHIIPLWNSNEAFGKPLAANMQSAVFYPLRFFLMLLPTSAMWDIYLLARILIAILLTYAFLRLIGLEKISSLVGGFIYGLGGYFILFISEAHINVDIIFPLLLISFESIIRIKKYAWILLGLSIFLMTTGGHPETAFLIGTFGLIYFILRLFWERRNLLKKILPVIYGILFGIGISMFLILPFFELYQYAYTSHGPGSSLSLSHDNISMIVNIIFPYFFGWPYSPFLNTWGGWSGTRGYIGIGAFFLLIVGIFSTRKYLSYSIIFTALLVFAITKSYGIISYSFLVNTPIYNAIYFQKYILVELGMSVAVLSAIGINYLINIEKEKRYIILIFPSLILIAAMTYLYKFFPQLPSGSSRKYIYIQYFIPLVYIVMAFFMALTWKFKVKKIYKLMVIIFALLVFFELIAYVPKDWPIRENPYKKPPYIVFLQKHHPDRVFGLDAKLYPNTASAFNINDIRDLDAVFVNHYFRYIQEFIDPGATDRFTGRDENELQKGKLAKFQDNPLFDLTNVKYVITDSDRKLDYKNQYKIVYHDEVNIYENLHVYPRAYLVSNVIKRNSDDEVIAELKNPQLKLRNTAVVKSSEDIGVIGSTDIGYDNVKIEEYQDQNVRLAVNSPSKSFLFLSDTFYPGWNAYVNGKKTKIYQTNLAFRGIVVPKGQYTVEFKYEPKSFKTGLLISAFSMLILLLIIFLPKLRNKSNTNKKIRKQIGE